MTWRSDTAQLVAGKWVSSMYPGLGVLGSVVRSAGGTGEHGPAPLYDDWDSAADDNKEFRLLIERWPANGTLTIGENSVLAYSGAADYAIGRLFVDGVDLGAETIGFFGGAPAAGAFALAGLGGLPSVVQFGAPVISALQPVATVVRLDGVAGFAAAVAFGVPLVYPVPEGGAGVETPAGRTLMVAQDGVLSSRMLQPLPFSLGARLDVVWDWGQWLEADELIVSSSVAPSEGLMVRSKSQLESGRVRAWLELSDLVVSPASLTAQCRITTSKGRIDSRAIRLVALIR